MISTSEGVKNNYFWAPRLYHRQSNIISRKLKERQGGILKGEEDGRRTQTPREGLGLGSGSECGVSFALLFLAFGALVDAIHDD